MQILVVTAVLVKTMLLSVFTVFKMQQVIAGFAAPESSWMQNLFAS